MTDSVKKIWVVRSGGFAGATRSAEVDLSTLPAVAARELEQMIADSDLPGVAAERVRNGPIGGPGADRFEFQVVIESNQGRQEVRIGEAGLSPHLKALIARVMELGRQT